MTDMNILTKTSELTGEDLLQLTMGMGERYELIEGELKIMSPAGNRHGEVAMNFGYEIKTHAKQHNLGRVLAAETGFYTRGDTKTVRGPDVAFISNEKIPPEGLPDGYSHIPPDLVVEVVSPNDKAEEIEAKIQEWLNFGVQIVWVAYPKTRHIHVHKRGETTVITLIETDTLEGDSVLPGFAVRVAVFFEE